MFPTPQAVTSSVSPYVKQQAMQQGNGKRTNVLLSSSEVSLSPDTQLALCLPFALHLTAIIKTSKLPTPKSSHPVSTYFLPVFRCFFAAGLIDGSGIQLFGVSVLSQLNPEGARSEAGRCRWSIIRFSWEAFTSQR